PPLHTRFRVEWKFKTMTTEDSKPVVEHRTPAQVMAGIGIVQEGDSILTTRTRAFQLPEEAEDARRVVAQLTSTLEQVTQAHTFAKGVGLAAPQVGISRAAAIVRTPE